MEKGVNIHTAKSTLSQLIEKVGMGEEVVISKAGKPVAKLVPYQKPKPERRFGSMKGKIWIADDFDDSLPDEILDLFYNTPIEPPE